MKTILFIIAIFAFTGFAVHGQTLAVKKQMLEAIIKSGASDEDIRTARKEGANKMIVLRRSVDLNKDGKLEYIVTSYVDPYQTVFVFQITSNEAKVLFIGDQRSDVTALKTRTNGWLNLRYQTAQSATGEIYTETLKFNGEKYK